MKPKNRFCLFTNNPNNELIFNLKNFLFSNYNVMDFTIFCDQIVKDIDSEYSVLPSFYLTFYNGVVLFDNQQDYENKKDLLGNNHEIYLIKDGIIQNVIQ